MMKSQLSTWALLGFIVLTHASPVWANHCSGWADGGVCDACVWPMLNPEELQRCCNDDQPDPCKYSICYPEHKDSVCYGINIGKQFRKNKIVYPGMFIRADALLTRGRSVIQRHKIENLNTEDGLLIVKKNSSGSIALVIDGYYYSQGCWFLSHCGERINRSYYFEWPYHFTADGRVHFDAVLSPTKTTEDSTRAIAYVIHPSGDHSFSTDDMYIQVAVAYSLTTNFSSVTLSAAPWNIGPSLHIPGSAASIDGEIAFFKVRFTVADQDPPPPPPSPLLRALRWLFRKK